jgi:hypothetical protein
MGFEYNHGAPCHVVIYMLEVEQIMCCNAKFLGLLFHLRKRAY